MVAGSAGWQAVLAGWASPLLVRLWIAEEKIAGSVYPAGLEEGLQEQVEPE